MLMCTPADSRGLESFKMEVHEDCAVCVTSEEVSEPCAFLFPPPSSVALLEIARTLAVGHWKLSKESDKDEL